MMSGQLSNQVLFELSQLREQPVVDWMAEWNRLYCHCLELENKFEALTEDVGDLENKMEQVKNPVDVPKVIRELAELSGESISFQYWDHNNSANENLEQFSLWSSRSGKHYTGKTFQEAEEKFRADFDRAGSFAEADAKEAEL
jgi:hypothetical protein